MNDKNLLATVVQNAQRRHFKRLLADDISAALADSIIKALYFPDSSDILQQAMSMLRNAGVKKQTFVAETYQLIDQNALAAIERLPDLPALLCFFPLTMPTAST